VSELPPYEARLSPQEAPWLYLGASIAGSAGLWLPDPGIALNVGLARARLLTELGSGPATARLALRATRSGGEAGYLGLEGEAIVAEVETAEARLDGYGFAGAAGLIESAWVGQGEASWGLRSIAGDLGEELGWLDRSDMGAWLGWTAPERWFSARLELTAGEGARWSERNEGKNIGGIVLLRPNREQPDAFTMAFFGRYGSSGIAQTRNHRVGFRIYGENQWFSASGEVLQSLGVDQDADRTPSAASFWIQARPSGPLAMAARLDAADENLTEAADHQLISTLLAGVAGESWSLLLGWQHFQLGPKATPIAGAAATLQSNLFLINLDISVGFSR
jgi:hypothetical protein